MGSREHRNQGPNPDSSSSLLLPLSRPPPQLINRRPLFRPGMDGAGGRGRGVFTHRRPGRQRPRPGHGPVRGGRVLGREEPQPQCRRTGIQWVPKKQLSISGIKSDHFIHHTDPLPCGPQEGGGLGVSALRCMISKVGRCTRWHGVLATRKEEPAGLQETKPRGQGGHCGGTLVPRPGQVNGFWLMSSPGRGHDKGKSPEVGGA